MGCCLCWVSLLSSNELMQMQSNRHVIRQASTFEIVQIAGSLLNTHLWWRRSVALDELYALVGLRRILPGCMHVGFVGRLSACRCGQFQQRRSNVLSGNAIGDSKDRVLRPPSFYTLVYISLSVVSLVRKGTRISNRDSTTFIRCGFIWAVRKYYRSRD